MLYKSQGGFKVPTSDLQLVPNLGQDLLLQWMHLCQSQTDVNIASWVGQSWITGQLHATTTTTKGYCSLPGQGRYAWNYLTTLPAGVYPVSEVSQHCQWWVLINSLASSHPSEAFLLYLICFFFMCHNRETIQGKERTNDLILKRERVAQALDIWTC